MWFPHFHNVSGFFKLGVKDWVSLFPIGIAVAGAGFLAYDKIITLTKSQIKSPVNTCVNMKIKKDSEKVVDIFDVEDIGDKAVYCRCWKSEKFPFCDGSHTKHNTETGDNVGPLIIGKKKN
nr:EOG090X0JRY [Eubosmina coregoni]